MSDGVILHGTQNNVEVLCYEGDIRYTLCLALDLYLTDLFAKAELFGFVVDLTRAEGIDSTNLGVLARLARQMQKRGLPKVTLISSNEDINEVLAAVGFYSVFTIVDHHQQSAAEGLEVLPSTQMDEKNMHRLLLDAHRELMQLNSQNRAMFRDVVAAFERERP